MLLLREETENKKSERARQRSRKVALKATKVRMTVMALPHPLVAENLGEFSLNIFDINESPNFI